MVNYALYNQCITHDLDAAEALYERAFARAPHNPVLLFCFGLCILGKSKYPREKHWVMCSFDEAKGWHPCCSWTSPTRVSLDGSLSAGNDAHQLSEQQKKSGGAARPVESGPSPT